MGGGCVLKKMWKIIIVIFAVIVILTLGMFITYRVALRPVLEKKVEQVANKINDGTVQKIVDSVAQEMIQEGAISQESIPTYSQYTEETQKEQVPVATKKPNNKPLMQRLEEAMTVEEFAFAMSLYKRIDINYAMNLLKTDRPAAKKYAYSKATAEEISRALEIYAKYAYILSE